MPSSSYHLIVSSSHLIATSPPRLTSPHPLIPSSSRHLITSSPHHLTASPHPLIVSSPHRLTASHRSAAAEQEAKLAELNRALMAKVRLQPRTPRRAFTAERGAGYSTNRARTAKLEEDARQGGLSTDILSQVRGGRGGSFRPRRGGEGGGGAPIGHHCTVHSCAQLYTAVRSCAYVKLRNNC
jgi:hypothetical protein